jgi:large subunit ribosomal protein L29
MKASELRDVTVEDLNDKLTEKQAHYTDLKSRQFISPLENPLQIRLVRRDIARIKTEIHKRNS